LFLFCIHHFALLFWIFKFFFSNTGISRRKEGLDLFLLLVHFLCKALFFFVIWFKIRTGWRWFMYLRYDFVVWCIFFYYGMGWDRIRCENLHCHCFFFLTQKQTGAIANFIFQIHLVFYKRFKKAILQKRLFSNKISVYSSFFNL
jgi:hypothetical protein